MKLRTRLLIFSSIFLLLLPWLGMQFSQKVQQSLLQGQGEAQSMVAEAIATLLNGSTSLFDIDKNALYVYPISQWIDIDAYDEDWASLAKRFTRHGKNRFALLLATRAPDKEGSEYLYAYLKVSDDHIVYRNPRNAALDASDHVRLEYLDRNNKRRRLVIVSEGQGRASVYEVKQDWRYWTNSKNVSQVYAWLRETDSGYDLELRIPKQWLEPNRRLSISVVNVFSEDERYPDTIVSTHSENYDALNPLLFQSPEIGNIINNLSDSDSRICVVDKYRRVRAAIGGRQQPVHLCENIDRVDKSLVQEALEGKVQVTQLPQLDDTLVVAAAPVKDGDNIIGAVIVGKNSRQVLSKQHETLVNVILATAGLFALAFLSLLFFSSWLTFRINRLKNQAAAMIDESGRFTGDIDFSDSHQGDELGELARSFSLLLDRLNSYTRFLETVPRMLRHEILNPVNTISMSLQQLRQHAEDKAVITAGSAVTQLQLIVSRLTEAASIDEALSYDEMEDIDIAALLSEYVENSQLKHPQANLCYSGSKHGVFIRANDIRIVQLLDKIKDNAIDFARPGTQICFHLDLNHSGFVRIEIKNTGDLIPEELLQVMFQGMVSKRPSTPDSETGNEGFRPHLGIGLYVAHRISRFHRGELKIANREDGQGVIVSIVFPLAERPCSPDKTRNEKT